MNKYMVAIRHYFGGYHNFIVEAYNKKEAMEKAKTEADNKDRGNYKLDDVKVIKKLRNK